MELFIPWHQDETVGLAISGGVDSMVLYHLLHTRYLDRQEKLVLFHVNHGQREASLYEAEYIRDMAMRDGHQFEMVTSGYPGIVI
ncbi:ATP-binding protein [Salinicoccus sp. CNSTN-B1]